MINKKYVWEEWFVIFEPGDKVTPTCDFLEVGSTYTVRSCKGPEMPGDDVLVYLEGQERGYPAGYFRLVENVTA